MRNEREGAVTFHSIRANSMPAHDRTTRNSIATPSDEVEQMSAGQLLLVILVGVVFVFSFMWIAAAY